MSQYTVLDRKRDRETNRKFMRMLVVSVAAHIIVLGTTAMAYRKPPGPSLREKAISVSLHKPRPAQIKKPDVKVSKPSSKIPGKAIEKPSEKSSAESEKAAEQKIKKVSTSKNVVPAQKTEQKAENTPSDRLSDSDRRLIDSALENIEKSVESEAMAGENAEWEDAFQEITSNLQVRAYCEGVTAIYYDAWVYPLSIRGPMQSCKLYIFISQDGAVRSYKIIQSSGNHTFDQSVLRAVQKVRALPPIPWLLSAPPFKLPVEFKPEQENS